MPGNSQQSIMMLHLKQPILSSLGRRFSMATSAAATSPGPVELSIREKVLPFIRFIHHY